MVLIGKAAPNFKAEAVMPDNTFKTVSLSDYIGKQYVMLYFYPLDFTFVCPSEIIAFSEKMKEFTDRNVAVLSVSVDSHFSHLAWKKTPLNKGGVGDIKYPMVSDLNKKISRDYDVLMEEAGLAFRGLFLIDKQGIIRHMLVNDLPLGRSVDEALRMVDALQHFEKVGEVCPANWKKGKPAMKASPEGVAAYLPTMELNV